MDEPSLVFTAARFEDLTDLHTAGQGIISPSRVRSMILEAAVATQSDWIVKHNVRDRITGAARFGVDVITPGEALRRLKTTR